MNKNKLKVTPSNVKFTRQMKYKFEIIDSILKTHFKELMKISTLYDSKEKSGYISVDNQVKFDALLIKINKSNDKRCKTSHAKSIEMLKNRKSDFCEHEDLGSMGYKHGETVKCPNCGKMAEVW